jgi:hypothetical protein
MNENLVEKFQRMGARAVVKHGPFLRLDVQKDKKGEFFDLRIPDNISLEVLDVKPDKRHLLLMSRSPNPRKGLPDNKDRYLCGHDERHWFVAGTRTASTVTQAMEALKPAIVSEHQQRVGVKTKDRNRRKNAGFIRQGEWFFVPRPGLTFDMKLVLENEPIRQGRSKPHICRWLYRSGGEAVWVTSRHPNGLTDVQYKDLLSKNPDAKKWVWQQMRRNAMAYAKGWVTHPDHATVPLPCWCEIHPSTEVRSDPWNRSRPGAVAFLD